MRFNFKRCNLLLHANNDAFHVLTAHVSLMHKQNLSVSLRKGLKQRNFSLFV